MPKETLVNGDKYVLSDDLMNMLKIFSDKFQYRMRFQLEVLMLCFFIPILLYQVSPSPVNNYVSSTLLLGQYSLKSNPNIQKSYIDGFTNVDEFYNWLEAVLYQEIYLTNDQFRLGSNQGTPFLMQPGIRIRQLRVSNKFTTCPYDATFMNIKCYPLFSTATESGANEPFRSPSSNVPDSLNGIIHSTNVTSSVVNPNSTENVYQWSSPSVTTEQNYLGELFCSLNLYTEC